MINDTAESVAPCLAAFDDARAQFIAYLDASGYSPNTARAYEHDLTYVRSFICKQELDWRAFTQAHAVDLVVYLREKRSYRRGAAQHPSIATVDGELTAARLNIATINRSRIVLHAGIRSAEEVRQDHIIELLDAIERFDERHDISSFRASEIAERKCCWRINTRQLRFSSTTAARLQRFLSCHQSGVPRCCVTTALCWSLAL
jgi:Phage integrase, N-terminal SAM-like domain